MALTLKLNGDPSSLLPLVGTTAAILYPVDVDAMTNLPKNGTNLIKRILNIGNRSYRFQRLELFN